MRVASLLATLLLIAMMWPRDSNAQTDAQRGKGPPTPAAGDARHGQQVFMQNCTRCHDAPETPSRREVRAVVQHMRVRANLSVEDERALLQFLAP